ncbi:MAG: 50S ribosomal protein L4, partial [Acidimicrobiia bacterium]|nr:50S ribosomal protein L4 [Acidimicrobiia bacterium]
DGQIRIVEGFDWDAPKTKKATDLLSAMDVGGKVLVVLDRSDDVAYLSLRNVENVVVNDQVNPYDILWADTVIFTVDTLAAASGTKDYSVGDEDFVKEVDSQQSTVDSQNPNDELEASEEPDAGSGREAGSGERAATADDAPVEASEEGSE